MKGSRRAERFIAYMRAVTRPVQAALEEALKKPCDEMRPAFLENLEPRNARSPAGNKVPRDQSLCFTFGSCQYPHGILDAEVADRSMKRLSERLDANTQPRPRFLLLLGDQVYVDATAGLFDPTEQHERYVRSYERLYQRKALQSVLRRLPTYMMLDDHEIDENWEPSGNDARIDQRLVEGRRSYWRYQRLDQFDEPGRDRKPDLSLTFEEAGVPFFIADTRTQRTARTAERVEHARIMSDHEFERLMGWLCDWDRKAPHLPKFVASPSILLPRHLDVMRSGCPAGALRSDAWDGFPHSLYRLLACIARRQIRNVVFLSGDEHLSCIATATLFAERGKPIVVHSIHSSALYAPYPFANSAEADFPLEDDFGFICPAEGGRYHCRVRTRFAAAGDGFAILSINGERDTRLRCEFVRDGAGGDLSARPHGRACGRAGRYNRPIPLMSTKWPRDRTPPTAAISQRPPIRTQHEQIRRN